MIYVNHDDEIVDYGKEHTFTYEGEEYVGYTRTYGNGEIDVEVHFKDDESIQVNDDVYEYAWKLFETMGLI